MAFTLGASFDKEKGVKTSTASYYHDKFNGRKTASGDRGPFSKKRAFDLSKAAFSKIADLRSGVVSISYEVVE